jgi:hypothetical protein
MIPNMPVPYTTTDLFFKSPANLMAPATVATLQFINEAISLGKELSRMISGVLFLRIVYSLSPP